EAIDLPTLGNQYYLDLANYYLESTQTDSARLYFERANTLSLDPAQQQRAAWGLGWVELMEKQYQGAVDYFTQVSSSEGYTGLGLTYKKMGRQSLADSLLRYALQLEISNNPAGLPVVQTLIIEGNSIVAFAPNLAPEISHLYTIAMEVLPDTSRLLFHKGMLLKAPLGQYRQAIQLFESLLETPNPGFDLEVYYGIATTYALWGKSNKALESLEMAIQKGFDRPELLYKDLDWDRLRGKRRFAELVNKYFPNYSDK
ncbi:MAG: tetratricopeptide repeat protein, partial [Bacteroidetes bacterium]